jgi:hypothetical protein
MHDQLRGDELADMFEAGEKGLGDGIDDFYRNMRELSRGIKKSLNDRQTNPAILTRRYMSLMDRLRAVEDSVFKIRSGYANIWEALEHALSDAPFKLASEQARLGYLGKISKNPTAKAQVAARIAIKGEWDRWQGREVRYDNEEHFGRVMHAKYSSSYKSERSIANLARKWLAGTA